MKGGNAAAGSDQLVVAYGFDRLGFSKPRHPVSVGEQAQVEFVDFDDTHRRLDEGIGAVVPQGIFEEILWDTAAHRIMPEHEIRYFPERLAAKELQVGNQVRDGRWIVFLVSRVHDELSGRDCSSTDLCKRILNGFGVRRTAVEDRAGLVCARSEFDGFIRQYGVARTVFQVATDVPQGAVILATSGEDVVGFEMGGSCFFLPFHTDDLSAARAAQLISELVSAVEAYRSKTSLRIPPWLDEFRFEGEKNAISRISGLQTEIELANDEVISWARYKAVLVASGDTLRDIVADILEDYFGLEVDRNDACIEDGLVLHPTGEAAVTFETKGVAGGVKRSYVNQVDTNRERRGLPAVVPGLLLINNEMNSRGVDRRQATTIHPDIVAHAKNLNVTILRSVDMLFLMRDLEESGNRGEEFLKMIQAQRGWIDSGNR